MLILNYFVWYNYPIPFIFRTIISRTIRYNILRVASLSQVPKCKYGLKQNLYYISLYSLVLPFYFRAALLWMLSSLILPISVALIRLPILYVYIFLHNNRVIGTLMYWDFNIELLIYVYSYETTFKGEPYRFNG